VSVCAGAVAEVESLSQEVQRESIYDITISIYTCVFSYIYIYMFISICMY